MNEILIDNLLNTKIINGNIIKNKINFDYSNMKKINESFICLNCGKKVEVATRTCRNHCPYCFASLHVD